MASEFLEATPFQDCHRSHFGSRYKLGCCGHAGLFGRGFDSQLRNGIALAPNNASLSGLLGGMKGLALEECTRRDPTQFHILVVAYRSTAHYSIKAQQNRCLVRWASQAQRIGTFDSCETQFAWMVFKKLFTLLDLCVSSLRRGHANLLCIVPICLLYTSPSPRD